MGSACGFFVFDYTVMDTMYGRQAFDAIQDALSSSRGTCAFCDGDVSSETVRQLAQQAKDIVPKDQDSPLADFDSPFDFGPYLAAMWTNTEASFGKIHSHLCSANTPGYLGYLTLSGEYEILTFVQAVGRQLSLPNSIAFVDGAVVPQTSKYGIR